MSVITTATAAARGEAVTKVKPTTIITITISARAAAIITR